MATGMTPRLFRLMAFWSLPGLMSTMTRTRVLSAMALGASSLDEALFRSGQHATSPIVQRLALFVDHLRVARQRATDLEVLALDDEARENALSNVNDLYVLDMLQDKTRMAFKRIVSLSYPDYSTEIAIANISTTPQGQAQLPPVQDAD